jgi:hypothetical protein
MGDQYYTFSSIFFYTGQNAFLLNGRYFNLEYGSNAPGAAQVFIDDGRLKQFWDQPERYYVVADRGQMAHLSTLLGLRPDETVASSGGKLLLTNHSFAVSTLVPSQLSLNFQASKPISASAGEWDR